VVAALLGARRRIRLDATPPEIAARVIAEKFGATLDHGAFPAGDIDPADVVEALVAAGVRVREIALETPPLEEVFLELAS
jgi:hypothetical protein